MGNFDPMWVENGACAKAESKPVGGCKTLSRYGMVTVGYTYDFRELWSLGVRRERSERL